MKGKTVSFYLSPAGQGYLAWTVKWLKARSQSEAIEEILKQHAEQHMLHGTVYTTWNKVAQALEHIAGNWDGFEKQEEDVDVLLTSLYSPVTDQPIMGWLEVEARNSYGQFDTCYYDAQDRATTIQDWMPPELHPIAPKREGIAVPVAVLGYITPE